MSKDQIKSEINKVLDLLTDKILEDLLSLLKTIDNNNTTSSFLDSSRLKQILTEDK